MTMYAAFVLKICGLGLASDEELKKSKQSYIGTEISKSFYDKYHYASQSETLVPIVEKIAEVDAKRADIVNTYFEDMAKNMIAVREELKQGGRYVIVVGDSNIRGQSIPTAKILAEIRQRKMNIHLNLVSNMLFVIDTFIFREAIVVASSNTMRYWC